MKSLKREATTPKDLPAAERLPSMWFAPSLDSTSAP